MKNRRGILLILVGVLLITAAVSLSGYNIWDDERSAKTAGDSIEQLLPMIPDVEELSQEFMSLPEYSQLGASEIKIPDYLLNPKMDMPSVQVGDYKFIGVLSIPVLGLELPVIEDWSYPLLKIAPCRYSGTAYQDDLVIAAHNYRHQFGGLTALQQGDAIDFTDMDGNVFHYTVSELEELDANEGRKMVSSDWDLTLFTCTLSGRTRFTVRCSKVA